MPGKKKQELGLKSKGPLEFIRQNVHFLICFKYEDTLRWEGKSYTVEGLGNNFSLHLKQDDGGEVRVFVEYKKHHEGNMCIFVMVLS